MVTRWPFSSVVAVVKVTVTALPVRPGTLSAAAIVLPTFETEAPIATVGPVAARSNGVETLTPVGLAATAVGPKVAPPRIMLWAVPAATPAAVSTSTTIVGRVPVVAVLQFGAVAVMAPQEI